MIRKIFVAATLAIMLVFAQIERDFIRQRQAEGISAAKARGVKFGRPPFKRPENYLDVRDEWLAKKISAREAGKLLGVNPQTFDLRALKFDARLVSLVNKIIVTRLPIFANSFELVFLHPNHLVAKIYITFNVQNQLSKIRIALIQMVRWKDG